MTGAGLFVRTLGNLRERGPGFSMTNLLMFGVNAGQSGYEQEKGRRVLLDLLGAMRALPEVESAGMATATPLAGGSWNQHITIQSDHRFVGDCSVHIATVSPGFFASLKTPILEGRDFDERDSLPGPKRDFRSAIVSESFAKRYFEGKSVIGGRVGLGNSPDTKTDIEIVGVVETFSYRGIRQDDDELFAPFLEGSIGGANYYIRTRVPADAAFTAIRAAARRVDPDVPLTALRTLDAQLDRSLSNERLLAMLAASFASLAVLLAVVGLYGVTSFVVASARARSASGWSSARRAAQRCGWSSGTRRSW